MGLIHQHSIKPAQLKGWIAQLQIQFLPVLFEYVICREVGFRMTFFSMHRGKTSHSLNTHLVVHHQVFNHCVESLGRNCYTARHASVPWRSAVFITQPSLRGWIGVCGFVFEICLSSLMVIHYKSLEKNWCNISYEDKSWWYMWGRLFLIIL